MLDEETFHRMRDAVFRRLTGVKKATFLEMQSVLEAAEERKKAHGGVRLRFRCVSGFL